MTYNTQDLILDILQALSFVVGMAAIFAYLAGLL